MDPIAPQLSPLYDNTKESNYISNAYGKHVGSGEQLEFLILITLREINSSV